jgi:phosphatidylserine/phosphatidylglycerophosphate/cardiolipin synthase-like enzyme
MRVGITKNGLTLRVIAGTHSAILALDLQENKRKDCLGFAIARTDLGPVAGTATPPAKPVWLPNMLSFPDHANGAHTTDTAPLQKFRWGDYTLAPAHRYRFRAEPRYGDPAEPTAKPELAVEVDVTTEDPTHDETAVFFNRAAAASRAFEVQFKGITTESKLAGDSKEAAAARAWLANGLEDALLAFLAKAKDKSYALHAAVYEFQKPELLAGLKKAGERGVPVQVAYHHRKKDAKDKTASENDKAVKEAKFGKNVVLVKRGEDPQSAIMHNKFVVLLKKAGNELKPIAVWTGSTNWTAGGIYGQLNVGHAVYDEDVAAAYERYFQLLFADSDSDTMKAQLALVTPVALVLPQEHRITPIFSPQHEDTMLHLYQMLCDRAQCLMVSAPFALSPIILTALAKRRDDVLRYLLLDKQSSLGGTATKGPVQEEVHVIQRDGHNAIAAAVTLPSPLHDFQGKLIEGKESFRHAGIHIHTKIILVDPLGSDPILVTGSANFSNNSTVVNDSNSLVVRGHTGVTDIYLTEFMRMFEHYHFRASVAAAGKKATPKPLGLKPDDTWSDKYYVPDSPEAHDRRMFAGTL